MPDLKGVDTSASGISSILSGLSSDGKINKGGVGSLIGGAIGSIIPGAGTAAGAAIGAFIGKAIKGGVHEGKDIKAEVQKELESMIAHGKSKNKPDSIELINYLIVASDNKIAHALLHGGNSKAKSSKAMHNARLLTFREYKRLLIEAGKVGKTTPDTPPVVVGDIPWYDDRPFAEEAPKDDSIWETNPILKTIGKASMIGWGATLLIGLFIGWVFKQSKN
jgi:hypothetical protein